MPSPVALGIVSSCRWAGRTLSGRGRLGRFPPLVAVAVVASVGFWLPGPASRVAGDAPADAPEGARTEAREGVRDDATADTTVDTSELAAVDAMVDVPTSEAADEAVTVREPPGSPSDESAPPTPSVPETASGSAVTTASEQDPDVPLERHERVVREKRELEARVAALEAETTALESEMLALDLQLVAVDSAARDAGVDLDVFGDFEDVVGIASDAFEPDAPAPPAPVELGNSTLVPAPLGKLEGGVVARNDGTEGGSSAPDAWSDAPDILDADPDPFLPGAATDAFVGGAAETASATPSVPFVDDGGASGRAVASASVGLPVERLVVAEVPYGSAADDAGLLPGDILVAIDDSPVTTLSDVDAYAASDDPAPIHEIEFLRGGRRQWVALADSPARLSLVSRPIDPARLAVD